MLEDAKVIMTRLLNKYSRNIRIIVNKVIFCVNWCCFIFMHTEQIIYLIVQILMLGYLMIILYLFIFFLRIHRIQISRIDFSKFETVSSQCGLSLGFILVYRNIKYVFCIVKTNNNSMFSYKLYSIEINFFGLMFI